MSLQDLGLLALTLFPFSLVGIAAVAMIRRRLKKRPQLKLVEKTDDEAFAEAYKEEKPKRKRKKRRSNRGKRK